MAVQLNKFHSEKFDSIDNLNNLENLSEEENFEDAIDHLDENVQEDLELEKAPSLIDSIEETLACLDFVLKNKFDEAYLIVNKWAHVSIYHALGKATLSLLQGLLILEPESIKSAMTAIKNCTQLCQQNLRQSNFISKVIWKPNYESYSEVEIHSLLCFAEAELMFTVLAFIQNHSFINIAKSALKVKYCYQSYKECRNILNHRTTWADEKSKKHFETGVRLGFGMFNLVISLCPSKVVKLLELIGFSGSRKEGMLELNKALNIENGLRTTLAAFSVLGFNLYLLQIFSPSEVDYPLCSKILKDFRAEYSNSAFFLLFDGRFSQISGNFNKAIASFNQCVNVQNTWKQIHNLCYWELLWCHICKCEWKKALYYADMLRKYSNWSPAIYTYQYSILLCIRAEETGDYSLKEKAMEHFKDVPKLRVRYAGKTLPAEKFAISQSENFINNKKPIIIPIFEYLYIWNIFVIVAKDKSLVNQIIEVIEPKIKEYEHEKELEKEPIDNYASIVFIKAICYQSLNFPLQAEKCFHEIIQNEKRIVRDTYLLPFSCLELAYIHIKLKDYNLAVNWLVKGRKDYSGFLLETPFQVKIQSAFKYIKKARIKARINQKLDEENDSSSLEDIDMIKKVSKELSLAQRTRKVFNKF